MKRITLLFATVCFCTILVNACSQGAMATRQAYFDNSSMSWSNVDDIERLIKSRLYTSLPYTINLKHEIRMQAQNDKEVYKDQIYWLNWADAKYAAFMRPNLDALMKKNNSNTGKFDVGQ